MWSVFDNDLVRFGTNEDPGQVTTHHEELLVQAAGVTELEGSLTSVKGGLSELDNTLDK